MCIYVETRIQCRMDDLWQKTQDPQLHERWDMRFSSIRYVSRESDRRPQRFRYSTRIGFGLSVAGEGETISRRDESGRRTSSLRFRSDDPKSLIREGAGYWQYVVTESGIRFITAYDYQTRFGWIGRACDRLAFRPWMGWATAISFDRLRLWIERGIDPAWSLQRWMIHAVCRIAVAFVWLYQGLVPKLIARDPDELRILADLGVDETFAPTALSALGAAEACFGVCTLTCFLSRWPLLLTPPLMTLAVLSVAWNSPNHLTAAFNPISLNFLMAVVSIVGMMVMRDLPSARRCLRHKPGDE